MNGADRDAPRKALSKPAAFVVLSKGLTLKTELTAERLRELLHYNPETGDFVRLTSWRSDRIGCAAKSMHTNGYSRISIDNKKHYAHRLAWLYVYGTWPKGDIDHINHQRTDNRIANLRDVSRSVNMENQIAARGNNKSSGVLGVTWHKAARKWASSIHIKGRNKYLGLYDEIGEAQQAYLTAKRELHIGCTI